MTFKQSAVWSLVITIAICCVKLAAQDAAETPDASGEVPQHQRVFNVEHAPIDSVANELKETFENDGNKWSLMITGKRLRVIGTQEQLQAASDLIARLDREASDRKAKPVLKQRVFLLKQPKNARDVIVRFEELFGEEGKWSVNVKNDQIEFLGTEEQVQAASTLVETLNEEATSSPANTDAGASDASSELHAFRLDRIDADFARRLLSALMQDSKDFRIQADPAANQLYIAGTADEMKQVDAVLKTLNELAPSGYGEEIRAFDLVGVDPNSVVLLLEKLLKGEGDVRIDATSNQLFFRGTRQQASLVESVLEQLVQKDRRVKVFQLKNSDATELAAMLKELLADEGLSFGVDTRTNAIVATGTEDALNVANALLLTLDAEETADPQSRSGASTNWPESRVRSTNNDPNELNENYATSERNAATRAAIYRWAEASGGHSDEELRKMKKDLQAAVEQAFAARQEAQSAEVDQLRRQLAAIETRVRQREAIKNKIIERRVEDLLANVDTSWWPQAPAASADGTVTQVRPVPQSFDPKELPNPQGKVQIEYVEGLDIIVLRGNPSDVKAVQGVIEKIERNAADATSPDGAEAASEPNRN
jgi:type II secretory pathway component GspD/PulD (secretin)